MRAVCVESGRVYRCAKVGRCTFNCVGGAAVPERIFLISAQRRVLQVENPGLCSDSQCWVFLPRSGVLRFRMGGLPGSYFESKAYFFVCASKTLKTPKAMCSAEQNCASAHL